MAIKLTDKKTVPSAWTNVIGALAVGLLAGLITGLALGWRFAPLITWDVAAVAYVVPTWRRVLKFEGDLVKKHALREDPSRLASDIILIIASLASLAGVAAVLIGAGTADGLALIGQAFLGLVSVVVSWVVVHTVYALRYAELYYEGSRGGVELDGTSRPTYHDFAYLAFTIGMTYQVSDTTFQTSAFRRTALKHALLSFLFGTTIIATMINLVANLGK